MIGLEKVLKETECGDFKDHGQYDMKNTDLWLFVRLRRFQVSKVSNLGETSYREERTRECFLSAYESSLFFFCEIIKNGLINCFEKVDIFFS